MSERSVVRGSLSDESNYDEHAILDALKDVSYSDMMIADYVPKLEGDDN